MNNNSPIKSTQKTLLLWMVLILGVLVLFNTSAPPKQSNKIPFNEFIANIKDKQIQAITFKNNGKVEGKFKDTFKNGATFETQGDTQSEYYVRLINESGVIPNYEIDEGRSLWVQILISWAPMVIFIFLLLFFLRQIQVSGGKAMSFGRSKARLLSEGHTKVNFTHVAGCDEAKEELSEIVEFLRDPKKFTRLGGKIPKGVLLVGSPGTGKTLLARAVAGEAVVPFFSISGSDFVEMFVGVGASRVRDLFEQGKKHAPCIIFIDEIDAVGRQRGAGLGGGHDEREQTLNQLLVEMDGFDAREGVILIAATNRPDVLDPALLRPGRFDRTVVVNKPDVRSREAILKVHVRNVPLHEGVNLEILARGTPGMSGADLENLVNEAALLSARKGKKVISMVELEEAKDKVLMGKERRSMVIGEEEKRLVAYHEASHTIVGKSLKGLDPVHKVTIIPRGMALGLTQTLPDEDRLNVSRTKAENMIAFLMGGTVAETLVFGEKTTGAGNDIERATDLARRMVCEWGMSDKLGPVAIIKQEQNVFLGREFHQDKNISQKTAELVDSEVRRIITENYKRAEKILKTKSAILKRMSEALLERETLDFNEIQLLMDGKPLPKFDPHGDGTPAEPKTEEAKKSPSKTVDKKPKPQVA